MEIDERREGMWFQIFGEHSPIRTDEEQRISMRSPSGWQREEVRIENIGKKRVEALYAKTNNLNKKYMTNTPHSLL